MARNMAIDGGGAWHEVGEHGSRNRKLDDTTASVLRERDVNKWRQGLEVQNPPPVTHFLQQGPPISVKPFSKQGLKLPSVETHEPGEDVSHSGYRRGHCQVVTVVHGNGR